MSTESNEQFRAGFEAWAHNSGNNYQSLKGAKPLAGDWYYFEPKVEDAWRVWIAAMQQREASTEPSTANHAACFVCNGSGQRERHGGAGTYVCGQCQGSGRMPAIGAGALTDEAKDAAQWRELLAAVIGEFPSRMGRARNGNAPGHCHDKPGIWDSDNGALAGKECAWCKVWNAATAAIAAHTKAGKMPPAVEAMDHDQLGKLGRHYENMK